MKTIGIDLPISQLKNIKSSSHERLQKNYLTKFEWLIESEDKIFEDYD